MDLLAAKTRGMDAYMNQHKLDAVLFAGSTGAAIAAKAGYPSVMVPGRLHLGDRRQGHARLSARRHLRGPCLERAQAPASGLRLRAGLSHAQAAAWLARPLDALLADDLAQADAGPCTYTDQVWEKPAKALAIQRAIFPGSGNNKPLKTHHFGEPGWDRTNDHLIKSQISTTLGS